MAQQARTPDLEAQRTAMKKIAFLAGRWAGEARLHRGPGEPILMAQTEDVQFKLDDGGLRAKVVPLIGISHTF